ncbi:trichohyalin isoform X3 [Electrophorus electricus]|uniref:trichohyalin isoform X3 n=1 Tax=Electrophorus electricus TaxID=8005 RepID=UPI0015CFA0A6|nr:trichohyalin isoform X3 [Electrophorus electricus]
MSAKENPCRKFQANIFNKSKCQNCFRPRESHLLDDEDFAQANPIYGGWLLLAPDGTNFENPLHRSRKWQRRFFLLYEHGLLRYALDEMTSTLPQGIINLNVCVDVVDGESTTGHKHSLCICTPDQEHYIRAESKEVITGWQEALIVFPRTNKQNQKKKRKVEPPSSQEPGPAKVAVTSSSSLGSLGNGVGQAEGAEPARASVWAEDHRKRAPLTASRSVSCLSQASEDSRFVIGGRKPRVESGYFSLEKTKPEEQQQPLQPQHLPLSSSSSQLRRSQVIERFETQQADAMENMDTSSSSTEPSSSSFKPTHQRTGRSERRLPTQKQDLSLDVGRAEPVVTTLASCRRAKSLDRRVTESSMTPDLLNFKKGWMTKLYEDGVWKKHWFVLTDQSLRYYRDSIAEEAADLDGEIDLSTCYDVTEFPVQRNYGFQIHSKDGVFTLSAMTSGIRRNWIQAMMKSVRPTITPDVTRSLPQEQRANLDLTKPTPEISQTTHTPKVEVQRSCDVTGDSASPHEQRKTRVRDRRREGRSKTFDWAEFRPGQAKEEPERPTRERVETLDISSSSSPSSVSSPVSCSVSGPIPGSHSEQEEEMGQDGHHCFHPSLSLPSTMAAAVATVTDGQRQRPLEEPQGQAHDRPQMEVDSAAGVGGVSGPRGGNEKPDVQVEIEQRWHQVETTPLREEKQVPIIGSAAHLSPGDRTPPQELAARLDKELGQTQRELARLQEENSHLHEQLQDARSREHSARSTTVAGQPSSATPSSASPQQAPWQRLSKLNQELKAELDAQRRKQDLSSQQVHTLRRSYSEAQDVIGHHEAEIEALQAKLASAMAETVAGEQVLARMRSELRLEQARCREREEDRARNEATLRAQLRDSEERLREVEATLLEKNQALRQLERQQALQRDQESEVQRLQDKLTEVTGHLLAAEEAQALREERERKEQRHLEEKHQRERLGLTRRLAESEERRHEVQDHLQEAQEQLEALLKRGGEQVGSEVREEVELLQRELSQRSSAVEVLRESVARLEEEKNLLACRCQELVNQITEADREVAKLKQRVQTEEEDYYSLERSYGRVSEELAEVGRVLRKKEEEVQHLKEMYELLVQRKEEDLKEACDKMATLGSSLEEAEHRLQVKAELLSQAGHEKTEPCEAERELKEKLVVAEDRIAELERLLEALRLGYADLRTERRRSEENLLHTAVGEAWRHISHPTTSLTLARSSSETEVSLAKRQRIRFANIQCQKYHQSQGTERFQDLTQDTRPVQDLTQDSIQSHSGTEKFISIIQGLESQLRATEKKLRDIAAKTQNRQTQADAAEDQPEQEAPGSGSTSLEYQKALVFVETCRRKLRDILSSQADGSAAEAQVQALEEIGQDLLSAALHTHQLDRPLEKVDDRLIKLFARMLAFEGIVLEKMAFSLQDPKSDLMQSLAEIHRHADDMKKSHQGYLSMVYIDLLAQKFLLERMLVEDLEKHQQVSRDSADSVQALRDGVVDENLLHSACFSVQLAYEFEELQRHLLKANEAMQQRADVVKEAVSALNAPETTCSEQIERQEAEILTKEIVERHLVVALQSSDRDAVPSLQAEREGFVAELRRQAEVLHCLSQQVERTAEEGSSIVRSGFAEKIQAFLGPSDTGTRTCDSLCMQEALVQAQVAYVACRLRADHQRELSLCRETSHGMASLVQEHAQSVATIRQRYQRSLDQERLSFAETLTSLQDENGALRGEVEELRSRHVEELARAELEHGTLETEGAELRHEDRIRKLEEEFREKIQQLERAHQEEIQKVHERYTETIRSLGERFETTEEEEGTCPMEEGEKPEQEVMSLLRGRVQELELQMRCMRDEMENKPADGDAVGLREQYQSDLDSLKETCERGFAAMEHTHQKVIEDLQRQHQREINKLLEERERLLEEETHATIAAIEAMKNAHREELEKSQRAQLSGVSADIEQLHTQYEEELQSIHRELEVLSEQYSQKCLENAHLVQALEAERQALQQCQRENQQLHTHNQELNNRLTVEITRMRSCFSGEKTGSLTQGKDLYELEVLLRIKESEIQYLKQEINSLKDELQSALRDKKYACDKYKDIYRELSIVRAKADCDITKLREKLLAATEALDERETDRGAVTTGYDIMKSKSNPDLLKNERSSLSKPTRGVRSKSLKEGLTVQERMKLFEAKDSRKI